MRRVCVVVMLLLALGFTGCGSAAAPKPEPELPPVVVEPPKPPAPKDPQREAAEYFHKLGAHVVWKGEAVVEIRLGGPELQNADLTQLAAFKSLSAITIIAPNV